ncbi:DNA gyrase subunit B (nucleomorph) [Guillardia theta]|uniref:DNA topoisomerase 2 n=1 Tax=Guillardia theta TaxID=55529 RepID=Q98RQ4_GUITH|nr:DNA gyrase subunit B [Guillardia theta]AAK39952.1 DNA gyrase subunit B [Guillardia theta]
MIYKYSINLSQQIIQFSGRILSKKFITDINNKSSLNNANSNNNYNANNITVLEGLEPVRRRPGVFIGSTGLKGFHHLVYEIVDNSVDESMAGFCEKVDVIINSDKSVTIRDNGRGIPTDLHPITNKTALETVLTILHAGGKFGGGGYKVSGGLHGVGVSVVNGLSEYLNINTQRNQRKIGMRFVRGKKISECNISSFKKNIINGTTINFKPDYQIFFSEFDFDSYVIGGRLNELAFLNSNLKLLLEDRRSKIIKSSLFLHDGGIMEYINEMTINKKRLHNPIILSKIFNNSQIEIGFVWSSEQYQENILSFVNNIRTVEGGTHVDGFKQGITKLVNLLSKKKIKSKEKLNSISGEFIREGLTCLINVKTSEPEFEGQIKSKLGNPDIKFLVENLIKEEGEIHFIENNSNLLNIVLEKAISAMNAYEASKKAKELVRKKSILEGITLPGKLSDCSEKNPQFSEIFIVEGDSAGGSAKQARDRRFQAILPLRGKIINIEKNDEKKIYNNTEIQSLISALGLGVRGNDEDLSNLRYHKIIIMTDADVDGAHIRTLLLTFFYRYQKELIDKGFVYIACPPLYKIENKKNKNLDKNTQYCYSEGELEYIIQSSHFNKNIQRFKGLGEMMPEQLWKTTMSPEMRILKKIKLSDAKRADKIFEVLMGSKVPERKKFIQIQASLIKIDSLDI